MARTRLTKNLETSMPLRQIIWAFLLIFLFSLTNSTASGQEQPSTAWQNIQRLLRSNGYTGVRETGNRSDWASNLALRLFCRNLDCNKYEKYNLTPEEKLAAWTFVLEEGLRRRLSGNYAVIELANVRPTPTPAYFIDLDQKIVSFDGDDFSIWLAKDFERLSYSHLGLDAKPPESYAYSLAISNDEHFSAAINRYWITVIDNRTGLVVGWLPLTLLGDQTYEQIKDFKRPEATFQCRNWAQYCMSGCFAR